MRSLPARKMVNRARCSVIACALAGFLAGLNLAQFSGVLELPSFGATFPGLTASSKSRLSAALLAGAVAGTPFAGPLCDSRGRGAALALSGALFLAAAVAIATAKSLAVLGIGRMTAGFAYALGNVAAPAFLAETAPLASRALYVNIYQLSINAGIVFAQLVNAVAATRSTWREIAAIPALPAAIMLALAGFRFAEPAAWLARKVGGGGGAAGAVFTDLRRDPSAGRRLRVAAGVLVAQQLTGVNGVILYAPALVMSLGLGAQGGAAPFWAAVAVGTANCVASAAAMGGVERAGRRALLLGGAGAIGIALTVLGAVRWNGGPAMAGVAALVMFIVAFAGSYGPLPFLVAAEVLPMRYRGVGLTIVGVVAHAASLIVVAAFLSLERSIGAGVYFVFSCFVATGAAFVYACVPETRGLALQEIDALFGETIEKKFISGEVA